MRTLLGVVLAVTPAALWIAWTVGMVVAILSMAALSAVLLVWLTPAGEEGTQSQVEMPPEFIDELQRLFPLTYHHTLSAGPSRFRRTMQRLQELLNAR
jgi:hypothetical protein